MSDSLADRIEKAMFYGGGIQHSLVREVRALEAENAELKSETIKLRSDIQIMVQKAKEQLKFYTVFPKFYTRSEIIELNRQEQPPTKEA